jgi:hypothetical protein
MTPDSAEPAAGAVPVAPAKPRLLLLTGNLGLLRAHYEGVIVGLARAGVEVSIRYISEKWLSADEYAAMMRSAGVEDAVTLSPLRRSLSDPDELLGQRLRELGNILRYSHPDYEGRTVLAERAFEKTAPGVHRWGRRIMRLGSPARLVARTLAGVDSVLPPSRFAQALLDQERPDAVVTTPVIRMWFLTDFLKAAAARRIPTAIWVQSWDNLTNKGLLHFDPDRVFVWNESQQRELARYHGVPAEHACITGAQTFEHWFSGAAASGREEFCARFGLDPSRPIILYLASSLGIAPEEPEFFSRWLRAVRSSSDPVLSSAQVLVRPHPTLVPRWLAQGLEREPLVAVSPSISGDAFNSDAYRAEYRDELHHATVAVGINTSGLIDAAIFGKPVCSVDLPELFTGQLGTVHFEHLAGEHGVLRMASSLEEHVAVLADLVRRDTYAQDERSMDFVRYFVRPHGLDVRPTEVFIKEMFELCGRPSVLAPASRWRRAAGRLLSRAAVVIGAPLEERPVARILGSVVASAIIAYFRARHRLQTVWSRVHPRLAEVTRLRRTASPAEAGAEPQEDVRAARR